MDDTIIFNDSAFKHEGVTAEDIRRVFDCPLFDGLIEGYNNKFLLTGFDTKGNLLEVMYNLVDEDTAYVFHAMPCRPEYRGKRNQY